MKCNVIKHMTANRSEWRREYIFKIIGINFLVFVDTLLDRATCSIIVVRSYGRIMVDWVIIRSQIIFFGLGHC